MAQNPRLTIRKADGSVWCSRSGENTYCQALRACLAAREHLTDAACALIERLCTERVDGVAIEQDGDFHRVRSNRPGCRVTIPLRHPKRRITSTGFNRLAAGLAADPHAAATGGPTSPSFRVPDAPALPLDCVIWARAALLARGVEDPDARTVEAVAAHIAIRGQAPLELLARSDAETRPGSASPSPSYYASEGATPTTQRHRHRPLDSETSAGICGPSTLTPGERSPESRMGTSSVLLGSGHATPSILIWSPQATPPSRGSDLALRRGREPQ